jgi:hypothetical protein
MKIRLALPEAAEICAEVKTSLPSVEHAHLLSPLSPADQRALAPVAEPLAVRSVPVPAALGLTIEPAADGRVIVTLPPQIARVFLEDLEQRALAWREALRKADLAERQRAAELRALSDETRLQVEAQEDGWLADYEQLRAEGRGHREALHIIRGPDEEDAPLLGAIAMGIRDSLSRRKAQARATRNADICRLAQAGLGRQEIADRLNLQHQLMNLVLHQAGFPLERQRTIRSKVPAAWCKGEPRLGGPIDKPQGLS